MSSITPSNINEKIGSTCFNNNTELMVSYLNGKNSTIPYERIHGLSIPCELTISVVDMRTYPDKDYWIIIGRILKMEKEDHALVNTVQPFYYPRDKFMLANIASIP